MSSLLAQTEGQVEVRAGNGAEGCFILVDEREERILEALVMLEEQALLLRLFALNTDPPLGVLLSQSRSR